MAVIIPLIAANGATSTITLPDPVVTAVGSVPVTAPLAGHGALSAVVHGAAGVAGALGGRGRLAAKIASATTPRLRGTGVLSAATHAIGRATVSATLSGRGALSALISASAAGPSFPRLSAACIGGPQDYYNYVAAYAKYDFVLFGMYAGWTGGGSYPTATAVVNAIKAINPNCLIGNYSYFITPWLAGDAAYLAAQHGPGGIGDWNLYDATGTVVSGDHANISLLTTPDANGDRWPQYAAKTRNGLNWTSGGAPRSGPVFDVWFMDNVFYQPRVAADWNRDGTLDATSSTTARTAWRAGYAAYVTAANALKPTTQIVMANTDSDFTGYPSQPTNSFSDYKGLWGGATLESMIGQSYSPETFGGWATMMNWYHQTFTYMAAPQMVVFSADWDLSTYQTARYAMASCLMDNGYFNLNDNSGNYAPSNVRWLDEFDLAGTATSKWLGTAVDPPQTTPWNSGVYLRRFAGGLALVNPKGNGTKTVTPPSGYKRITGTQDPTTNNGAAVTGTVTLADRDGLLLIKL